MTSVDQLKEFLTKLYAAFPKSYISCEFVVNRHSPFLGRPSDATATYTMYLDVLPEMIEAATIPDLIERTKCALKLTLDKHEAQAGQVLQDMAEW